MSYQAPAVAATPAAAPLVPVADPYSELVDLNQVLTPEQREQYKQNTLTGFSTGGAVFLSLITLGFFSSIYYLLKHDQLPKVKADDPSAGKAIGFMFIPFFNLYWMFVAWPRLIDRINFQFRLRGRPAPIARGQVIALLVLSLVGWVIGLGWIAALVLWIMLIISTQNAINELAAERQAAPLGVPAPGTTS